MSLTDLKYAKEANEKLKAQLASLTKERDELREAIHAAFNIVEAVYHSDTELLGILRAALSRQPEGK